jgi:hypothetical protein
MAKNHAIQRLAGLTRDARKSSSSSGRLMTPSPVRTTSLFYINECSAGNADRSDRNLHGSSGLNVGRHARQCLALESNDAPLNTPLSVLL